MKIDASDLEEIMLPIALKVTRDFIGWSVSVINAFYSHYTPRIYVRKYGLMNMWEVTMKPKKLGYEIQIDYSDEYFTASHDNDKAVFEGSFVQGYHGGKKAWKRLKPVVPMDPSPWTEILAYFNNYELQL